MFQAAQVWCLYDLRTEDRRSSQEDQSIPEGFSLWRGEQDVQSRVQNTLQPRIPKLVTRTNRSHGLLQRASSSLSQEEVRVSLEGNQTYPIIKEQGPKDHHQLELKNQTGKILWKEALIILHRGWELRLQ